MNYTRPQCTVKNSCVTKLHNKIILDVKHNYALKGYHMFWFVGGNLDMNFYN